MPPADAAEQHLRSAQALQVQNRLSEAIENYERALALRPDLVAAHVNLGVALAACGRHADAIEHYRTALTLHPELAGVHMRLGNALMALERADEAAACYEAVLAPEPRRTAAHVHLGNALEALGRYDEAIAPYRRALELEPDLAEAHYNLANVLRTMGRDPEALHHHDRALASNPDLVHAKHNKAMLCLNMGRLAEGWELYEHRWAAQGLIRRPDYDRMPRWHGEPVEALLAWGEQELGDQILYAGMIADLAQRVGTVGFAVEHRLVALFARSFPAVQVFFLGGGLDRAWEAQAAVADLGRYLRPSFAHFPRREQGYLVADGERTNALRAKLARDGRRVVGLSWRSLQAKSGVATGATLIDFAAVLGLPGCRFIDLQYGDTAAERESLRREIGVEVEHVDEVDNTNDIDGLAALIAACDLVITISNVTAHLAGALGTTTFAFVPFERASPWYWFKDRTDSPWYPRVQIRHQGWQQAWADLVGASRQDIANAVDM